MDKFHGYQKYAIDNNSCMAKFSLCKPIYINEKEPVSLFKFKEKHISEYYLLNLGFSLLGTGKNSHGTCTCMF